MAPSTVNILLSSFEGLSLPPTLSIPLSADLPITSFAAILSDRLPAEVCDLLLHTTSSRRVDALSTLPISTLLQYQDDDFLPLRLSASTLGGKGGFGSQLRAAGGRMSSRKNRSRNKQDTNGSNRNLDGRRLRTITEAKNLATYLAMKPDMDKKEKEEKRKRWEAVVEAAEKKQEEINEGKKSVRVDGQWVEAKEEIESKTRDAVMAAMKAGLIGREHDILERTGSESSAGGDGEDMDSDEKAEASGSASGEDDKYVKAPASRTFYGWDEDDEDISDEEEDEEEEEDQVPVTYQGKGKAKA